MNLSTIDGFVRSSGVSFAAGSYIIPVVTDDNSVNGANFLAAYTQAAALNPGGSGLSSTNRACVLLLPGTYSWAGTFTPIAFVDIAGISSNRADVQLVGTWGPTNANYNVSNLTGGTGAFGANSNFSGIADNCAGGSNSFGGGGTGGNFSGVANNCSGGNSSFGGGTGGVFSGTANNCTALNSSFGGLAGAFTGTANNCSGVNSCFGSGSSTSFTGTANYCSVTGSGFGSAGVFSGTPKITGCVGGSTSFAPSASSATNVLMKDCRLLSGSFVSVGSISTTIKIRNCINADLSAANIN